MTTRTSTINHLDEITKCGQSIWYDNIERRLLNNGELKRLIDQDCVVGVTTNPSIFEKAIASTNDYDESIRSLAKSGKSADEICEALMIDDVSRAAELLKGVYERSNHADGYVSIEVPPRYAYNPDETVKSGRRLFKQIGKPNIMIKVPGTSQGLPAIRRLVADGININVTLLFSKPHYQAITDAYIAGLNDRLTAKLPLKDIFSVASVFVSRIDTKIDNMIKKMIDERKKMKDDNQNPLSFITHLSSLQGQAAVANSKIIYQVYKDIFWGNKFVSLLKGGANRQRILWASTSTKNPAYSATKYVEELLGPDSINTIPPQTLQACKEKALTQGDIACGLTDAHKVIQDLAKLGIDVNRVCDEIQKEGVKAFEDSFNKLLEAIRIKNK